MTIERTAARIQIICDSCPALTDTYDQDDFQIMMTDARAAGWSSQKINTEWQNTCPDCRRDAGRQRRLF
jgi:Fe2+ or Zn2+ uptake regulation protein